MFATLCGRNVRHGEDPPLLSIGKLNKEMADYYERTVADSREDYYALRGEAEGKWWGRGAEALELRGTVDKGELGRLVASRDPKHPEKFLGRPSSGADQVGAFDLTFSAPKSVSILYALASPEVQQQVVAAHDHAVQDALGYMEDNASVGRRGSARKGTLRQVRGEGFVAALYRHRVSRPVDMPDGTQRVDPQLHTHCIVANRTRSVEDGSWGPLDGRHTFRLATTGGHVYQASLRDQLTSRLGVGWMPVVNGQADIPLPGLDRLVDAFSSRRRQIREAALQQVRDLMVRTDLMTAKEAERHIDADTAMKMLGTDGMRVATLASRQAKGGAEGTEGDLRLRWVRQATHLGLTPDSLTAPLGRVVPSPEFIPDAKGDRLLAELTERVSTFTRHDAVRSLVQHAPAGASRAELERAVDQLLADPSRVRTLHADRNGDTRFTTPEVQDAETKLVEAVRARTGQGTGLISPTQVAAALAARPELLTGNAEQAEMVRRLARGGGGVATVIGPAGTGKTRGLEAYVAAARTDGRHVVGAAFTGAAAELLEGQTRAPSYTVHKLLGIWRREPMPPGAVVIVDEAGQLNRSLTGELVALAARDRTKLILAGDPKQMQPMDSGGPFRVIHGFTPETDRIELTVNRRQRDAAERRQLALLRGGETREAMEGYMRHGQIVQAPDGAEVRMRMVADWWDAYHTGKDTLLLGRRRVDVDLLNDMARQRCVEGGLVRGPAVEHEGRTFQAGDELLCLKNDNRRSGVQVRNGMRGRVEEVDVTGWRLRVTFRGGQERWIPLDIYPDIAHGWAMTVEKAQGQTVDSAFVMRPAAAGHEWHYTALSRGRDPVKYYLVGQHPDMDAEGTSHAEERDDHRSVEDALAGQWRRVEGTELSVEFDPHMADRSSPTVMAMGANRHVTAAAVRRKECGVIDEAPIPDVSGKDAALEALEERCATADPEIAVSSGAAERDLSAEATAPSAGVPAPEVLGEWDGSEREEASASAAITHRLADETEASPEGSSEGACLPHSERVRPTGPDPDCEPSIESRESLDARQAFDAQLVQEKDELEAEPAAENIAEPRGEGLNGTHWKGRDHSQREANEWGTENAPADLGCSTHREADLDLEF